MSGGAGEQPPPAQAAGHPLVGETRAGGASAEPVSGAADERRPAAPPEARPATSAEEMLAAYDYALPESLIAQHPAQARTEARLLPIAREDGRVIEADDARVGDLGRWLRRGDLLVVNTTAVIPARLRGRKASGGRCEALLLDASPRPATEAAGADPRPLFRALVKSSGRLRLGLELIFSDRWSDAGEASVNARESAREIQAEIVALAPDGTTTLAFEAGCDPFAIGEAPLPPYIRRPGEHMSEAQRRADLERYQTVFAREPGAVAAPTAGLHLTPELLAELADAGIERAEVVLHVGLGTFRPLRPEDIEAGRLHRERYALPPATAEAIARTRARGGRVVAVGTTTTRVLEHCADGRGGARAGSGETDLFIKPGSPIRVVDGLLTNFHLPGSSLLMLVAAFIGHAPLMAAYRHAVDGGYRFFSYGDAMLVLPDIEEATDESPSTGARP
jgi:S-adenosylmethionine:tRNA ribosyltransferase-isomerase